MSLFLSLPCGHMIRTMAQEHQIVLDVLARLERMVFQLKIADVIRPIDLDQLRELTETLLDAESHHRREEDVLFPMLEALGIDGPPAVMRAEHDDMRESKKQLLNLCQCAGSMAVEVWRREVFLIAANLIGALREHIEKEDNILYPAALQSVPDATAWQEMKTACDQIGYCKFTPEL